MFFHSTRGKDKDKDFSSILMQGLADDGGLFMPDYWPQIDLDEIKSQKSFRWSSKMRSSIVHLLIIFSSGNIKYC